MKHTKKDKNKKSALKEKLELLKSVSLTEEDRDRMGSFLSRYVELHPVLGREERVIKERKEKYSAISGLFRQLTPAFAVFIFFVWGGVALAGTALPGDPLYGVKTTGEKIRDIFSFDTERSARYKAERINFRLNEAHELLKRGSVSEKSVQKLARELRVSLEDLRASLDELEVEGEYLAAFEIEKAHRSSIDTYQDIFLRMSEESEDVRNFLENIAFEFGLESNYFALNTQRAEVPVFDEGGGGAELSMLSLVADEAVPVSSDEATGVTEENARTVETEMISTASSDESIKNDGVDLEMLKLYASVRISETERQIERARKIDPRLRDALEAQLEEARLLYEEGVSAEESGDEGGAHELLLDSLNLAEEVHPLLRMARNKPSELFVSSILEALEEKGSIVEEVEVLLEEEEVRGSREGNDDASSEADEAVVDEDTSEERAQDPEGEPLNLEGVRELIDGIEL